MKNLPKIIANIFTLYFMCVNVYAQAIKIYVTDSETGKNVSNAKVCLEGFEIPPINAQYNKKANFYYFNEIPKNYNTVMVYHKNYNEKGFQKVEGLPEALHIELHNPMFIDNNLFGKNNYYIEDPYKIVIELKEKLSYNESRKKIIDLLKQPSLSGLELINPFWELKKKIVSQKNKDSLLYFFNFPNPKVYTDQEPYPLLNANTFYNADFYSENSLDYGKADIFPTLYGFSSDEAVYSFHRGISKYDVQLKDIIFFVRKKNGKKFKRFNDEMLNEISKNKNFTIQTVLYKKTFNSTSYTSKDPKYFSCSDKLNQKFNTIFKIDSSKMFFYHPYFNCKKENFGDSTVSIEKNYELIPINNKFFKKSILFSDVAYRQNIGLGILDLYEYYNH
jgi:hypothetical protein